MVEHTIREQDNCPECGEKLSGPLIGLKSEGVDEPWEHTDCEMAAQVREAYGDMFPLLWQRTAKAQGKARDLFMQTHWEDLPEEIETLIAGLESDLNLATDWDDYLEEVPLHG